jgi:peptidyl-prolyl cis-trans isomerase B (cyclophilin B)
MRARALPPLALLGAALALTACGGGGGSTSTSASLPSGCQDVSQPSPKHVNLKPPPKGSAPAGHPTAVVETSCGTFTIALDAKHSPKTVASFVYMADHGLYDDTTFHGVSSNLIQGGDPAGDGTGGPGYSVDEPPPDDTEYTRGTVAMAKTAVEPPGRSGSQFFVVTAADAGLDPVYAVLGTVASGMATVDRIDSVGVPQSDTGAPSSPIVIDRITVQGG